VPKVTKVPKVPGVIIFVINLILLNFKYSKL
jgi:hypothetical protein